MRPRWQGRKLTDSFRAAYPGGKFMTRSHRIPSCVLLLVIAAAAHGESLRLKNGISLAVSHVRDIGSKYEYYVGSTRYTVNKSEVEGIYPDTVDLQVKPDLTGKLGRSAESVMARRVAEPGNAATVPAPDRSAAEREAPAHRSTPDELAAAERKGDKAATFKAYFEAAKTEFEVGDRSLGIAYLEHCLALQPNSAPLLSWYVAALMQAGRISEAVPQAQRMADLAPDAPEALDLLGMAMYRAGRPDEALSAWRRSLHLRPDDDVKKLTEQAEREVAGEAGFQRQESSHFAVRYEGKMESELLARDILQTLETHYNELGSELDLYPRETVTVVIYGKQPFFDVTQAPKWSRGLNDGTLRIPVEGLRSMTPELSRVLKHELTHSFLTLLTYGRCPGWLHEGMAQLLEPAELGLRGRLLSAAFSKGQYVPLQQLRGSFTGYNGDQARMAYAESLAVVEYVRSRYGLSALQQILKRIAGGSSAEEALQTVISQDYDQLEKSTAEYLASTYGGG